MEMEGTNPDLQNSEMNIHRPRQKALQINLDPKIYGTFAEIGAGQEVARFFFQAGAASMTVAKTMSAYDMTFSDAIYGKETSGRYVVESRLCKMLDHEYELLLQRLEGKRKQETLYFAFANTVATINFQGTNESHGWVGIRFQTDPGGPHNEVRLHMRLLDRGNLQQQQVVGTVGVNLIYSAFFIKDKANDFVKSLWDDLTPDRIEIDAIKVTGPAFAGIDNRVLSLQLVKNHMAYTVMFNPEGQVVQPSDVLYKKHVLALRARFRPPTLLHEDMIENGKKQFIEDFKVKESEIAMVCLISMEQLTLQDGIDEKDFLARVELIGGLGHNVLISNYFDFYELSTFFTQRSKHKAAFILGMINLKDEIFKVERFQRLPGGLLQALGILQNNISKFYVYPALAEGPAKADPPIENCENIQMKYPLKHAFDHFYENGLLSSLKGFRKDILTTNTRDIVRLIQEADPRWEKLVSEKVVKIVQAECLFGYPCCPLNPKYK